MIVLSEALRRLIGLIDQQNISINRSTLNNQLVEVTLMTNVIRFSEGDILGIRLQQRDPPIRDGISVEVLKQSRGYGTTLDCLHTDYGQSIPVYAWCNAAADSVQEKPYIAINLETGEM